MKGHFFTLLSAQVPGSIPGGILLFFFVFFYLEKSMDYDFFFRSIERHHVLFTMSRASWRYAFYFHEHPESKVMPGQLNSAAQLPPPYVQVGGCSFFFRFLRASLVTVVGKFLLQTTPGRSVAISRRYSMRDEARGP